MLLSKGGVIYSEIIEQPTVWQQAIKLYNKERETLIWIKKMKFNQVVFIGAGASYYASIYASYLFRSIARIQAYAFQSSDIYSTDTLPFDARLRTLVIAISRSGKSDETVWAAEYIKKTKPDVQILSVTCNEDTPLKGFCEKNLAIEEAADDNAIPIRSFSTAIYLLNLFAGALGGKSDFLGELSKIPKTVDIKEYHAIVGKMRRFQDFKRIVFAGTGANYGLAAYASLIMKQMTLTSSQYFNTLEFRHNHFITASPDTLAVFLLSDSLREQELGSVRDASKMRAQLLLIDENLDEKVEAGVEYAIKLQSNFSPLVRAMLVVPYLQLIAFQHALALGKNADKPIHVVDTVNYKSKPEFLGVSNPQAT
jgi:glucosamine--fructose-6-phosphate aminotransferase (isomerizing)